MTRWRKYGKDRLYVTAAEGSRIGWYDLAGGQSHLEQPAMAETFHAAVTGWLGASLQAPTAPRASGHTATPERSPTGAPPLRDDATQAVRHTTHAEPSWEDLAAHRPGAMAREQAIALKEAAPER